MIKILAVVVFGLFLSGCAITEPVVVIAQHGQVLRGTTTASMVTGGSFSVTDGNLMCSGDYNAWNTSRTITMQVLCSDGRKGIIIATREKSGIAGSGTVHLNDGTEGTFIFGPAAANF